MLRKLLFLILLSAIPGLAFGQGTRIDNPAGPATRNVTGFLAPIPGASIAICTSAATGTPCAPLVPTSPVTFCTDATCSTAAPNPLLADSNGNWGGWLLPGTYKVSITATGVTGTLLTVTVPIGTGSSVTFTGTNTFSGSNTFSQPIISTVTTGTAPLTIASTTVIPNLNAQLHGGQTAPASAIVGINDTQTLTAKTLTSPALTTPTIGGTTITNVPLMSCSANMIGATSTGLFGLCHVDSAITVLRVLFQVPVGGTVGTVCGTSPVIQVGGAAGTNLTMFNSSSGGNTGAITVNVAAGDVNISILTAASGCTVNWANVYVSFEYRMQ